MTRPTDSQQLEIHRPQVFDRRMRAVAVVTTCGTLVTVLDTTIVQVAVPTLVDALDTSLSAIQWVTTAYLLALASVVPLSRWMVDRFGAKSVWMTAMAVFFVGSLLSAMSPNIVVLAIARVVQGLGGGLLLPVGQIILTREAGRHRLGRVMGVVGIPMMLGPMLGPVLGGLILTVLPWPSVFLVNAPICLYALVAGWRVLSRGDRSAEQRLDLVGLALLPPGLLLFVYAVVGIGDRGGVTPGLAAVTLAAVALLGLFTVHAFRSSAPLIDLRLLRNRGLAASQVTMLFYGLGIHAVLFLVQLYYQAGRGLSALESALLVAPAGVGAVLVVPFAGWLMDRYGSRWIVVAGLIAVSLGVLPMTVVDADTSIVWLAACWFVRGLGVGAVATPLVAAAYVSLPRQDIPGAAVLVSISMNVSGALGVAGTAVLLQQRIESAIPGYGGIDGVLQLSGADRASIADQLSTAFSFAFWITVVLSLLAVVPALLLPKAQTKPDDEVKLAAKQAAVPD